MIPRFEEIFSPSNLLESFLEFRKGKKTKDDVLEFSASLMSNLFSLHADIISGLYQHSSYVHFKINDPKPRDIHKASVRDRVVHHALYRALYWHFDQRFIYDSYSCRVNKGTHRAVNRFERFSRQASQNYTQTAWVLKCDIKKCFASVDHIVLKDILGRHIIERRTMDIVNSVIDSFFVDIYGKGIPLGNLTSQLFINIYLNEFDQFVKRVLKVRKYIRYADDFATVSPNREWLISLLPQIRSFLKTKLGFSLHPKKISLKTVVSGNDFLGWVHFPYHRILRIATRRKMLRRLAGNSSEEVVASYEGLLKHGNTYKLSNMQGLTLSS